MFKRMFVLLLIATATLSVSTPAQASTLTVTVGCAYQFSGDYFCVASTSGGTGTYTSYQWTIQHFPYSTYYYTTSTWSLRNYCGYGNYYGVSVTVTDSAGATGTGVSNFSCTYE